MSAADHATVREGLEAAEGADFDAGRRDAKEVFARRIAALDALVARAEAAERAVDKAKEFMAQEAVRAEAAEADNRRLRDQHESLMADIIRLREALREAQAVLIEISSKPYRAEEATAAYFARAAHAALATDRTEAARDPLFPDEPEEDSGYGL